MKNYLLTILMGWFTFFTIYAQQPIPKTSSELYDDLQKLNFLGTALYIAAHPDDENSSLISYLANETKARTAYLALTRGDGGQNLIGSELREALGVLRTQELLAARRLDGGEQFFTRANDFGYSKHPKETLEIWNKDSILSDVVWAIRRFRPDVIINRFDHRTPGTTHGHHTSSAMLSVEAFDMAGDSQMFSDQLNRVSTWQPKRIFFNTSWWFYGSEEKFLEANKENLLNFDIGKYFPSKGMSNNEMASIASSQHLSQGWGRLTTRGSRNEYLEFLKGDKPQNNDIFSGIDTSWKRVKGGKEIGDILTKVEADFNFQDPSVHLPELLRAYKMIQNLEDEYWRNFKTRQITALIEGCSGFLAEVITGSPIGVPGETIDLDFQVINRSTAEIIIEKITLSPSGAVLELKKSIPSNEQEQFELQLEIPENAAPSTPYWLNKESTLGMYSAPRKFIGLPETPPAASAEIALNINGVRVTTTKNVVYKHAEPDKGELYEPFEILPAVTSSLANKVYIFNEEGGKHIPVSITAHRENTSGILRLDLPEGWTSSPEQIDFSIKNKGESKTYYFQVMPPSSESTGALSPIIELNGKTYDRELIDINYKHIPRQRILMKSSAKVVRLNIEKAGENIGYIMGAGDEVPESLKEIGYVVIPISPSDISPANLDSFDAIVTGIRAYNVLENELRTKQQYLLDYVKNGGTLIIQYNTVGRSGFRGPKIAPYELNLSRKRVTDENSPVRFMAPTHPVLNTPNKIVKNDFSGWVQERGLYFPDQWASEFTPVLAMNDPGEEPALGSLLVAPYGAGYYIYTGLSFFRELPAGVPGAYKLFANMLSLGKTDNNNTNSKG
ncbi:LmbE family protein [Robertkochia marina]|uniref:LmbE family protein n=1 Tax=Robertkochia marina TaxID=1227945 RepID=A0A4S3M228_9FLAO|nr:PIG-L family deacetylase [Robertkochia marina]THD67525.1 LmbE family protein [Robertkochia marina]TRZ44608.1 LmbE family protein [Robertkochia marina]